MGIGHGSYDTATGRGCYFRVLFCVGNIPKNLSILVIRALLGVIHHVFSGKKTTKLRWNRTIVFCGRFIPQLSFQLDYQLTLSKYDQYWKEGDIALWSFLIIASKLLFVNNLLGFNVRKFSFLGLYY